MSQHTATLPPLPEGWVWTTLGEIRLDLSQNVIPQKFPDTRFSLYSIPSFDKKQPESVVGQEIGSNKQTVAPKTVLLSKINPRINRVWVVDSIADTVQIASTEWIPFFFRKELYPQYLAYFLMKLDFQEYLMLNVSGVGGSLMRIKPSTLVSYPFPLAPLAEQQRIVEALETLFTQLDAGVQALKRSQANLQRYRSAVLKAACEGTLVAQDPNDEPASQLLTRILAERYEHWEETERAKGKMPMPSNYKAPQAPDTSNLPELPAGWVWATVEQVLEYLQYGTSVKADAEAVNGVPVLRMGNIKEGSIAYNNLKYLDPEKEDIEKYTLHKQDILINRTNSPELVGKSALFQGSQIYTFASYLIRIRCIYGLVNPSYLVFCFNSEIGRSYIAKVRHQVAGQANINSQDIRQFNFPLPPLAEQARIVEEVERRLSVVQALEATLEANLARAERLRQSILKQAFSGQLVPQDPSDEPASQLLAQIQAERAPAPKSAKQRTQTRMDLE